MDRPVDLPPGKPVCDGCRPIANIFSAHCRLCGFDGLGVIDRVAILEGLFLGVCVFVGSLLSKRIVLKMREEQFIQMIEWVIAISGLAILMMSIIHQ